MPTGQATENLGGLAMALLNRPRAEGESELEGALLAVDHVNRLAWRYFVENLPYQGQSVMQQVILFESDFWCGVLGQRVRLVGFL